LQLSFSPAFVCVSMEQVTAFGSPQVECAAHRRVAFLQLGGRLGVGPLASIFTTPATHCT
jgi:hypothetical protein